MIATQVATSSILTNVLAGSVKTEERKGIGTSDASNGTNFGNAWQSPVPYLLGGLAAMFFVITLAIIILACSCWNPSSTNGAHGAECRLQQGGKDAFDEEHDGKVVVIMAGDENPTFIATPTPMAA